MQNFQDTQKMRENPREKVIKKMRENGKFFQGKILLLHQSNNNIRN